MFTTLPTDAKISHTPLNLNLECNHDRPHEMSFQQELNLLFSILFVASYEKITLFPSFLHRMNQTIVYHEDS